MRPKNIISEEDVNVNELVTRLENAYNTMTSTMSKPTSYKESRYFRSLQSEIKRITTINLSLSLLRDLMRFKHKGGFHPTTFQALDSFCKYFEQYSMSKHKNVQELPIKQRAFWGVNNGASAGIFINGFNGPFIPWNQLETELNEKVISNCPRLIPVGSKVRLCAFYGKKDWLVKIINPQGEQIGDVWLGSDPRKQWKVDGLIRIGFTINDSKWIVWQVSQRYSDGSYRVIKSYV